MIQATHNKTKLLVLTDGAVFLTTQQKKPVKFQKICDGTIYPSHSCIPNILSTSQGKFYEPNMI